MIYGEVVIKLHPFLNSALDEERSVLRSAAELPGNVLRVLYVDAVMKTHFCPWKRQKLIVQPVTSQFTD
jgi:hypothetical protein